MGFLTLLFRCLGDLSNSPYCFTIASTDTCIGKLYVGAGKDAGVLWRSLPYAILWNFIIKLSD